MWHKKFQEWLGYKRQLARHRKAEADFLSREGPEHEEDAHDYFQEQANLEEWWRLIETDYLRFLTRELQIEFPAITEPSMFGRVQWDNDESQPYYLTDAGIRLVRERVRSEKKHRREVAGFWIASVVGVIGALTGLVSVFKS